MQQSPIALQAYVHDLIRERLAEAANDALADQLPHRNSSSSSSSSSSNAFLAYVSVQGSAALAASAFAVRHYLASGLRALAIRLDPCVAHLDATVSGESALIGASSSR
jgi:hypothetical protein